MTLKKCDFYVSNGEPLMSRIMESIWRAAWWRERLGAERPGGHE